MKPVLMSSATTELNPALNTFGLPRKTVWKTEMGGGSLGELHLEHSNEA